ncbi:MAG: DegT/DnrJ/EryC1/StrS family aminotransferase [Granulosicoccus sp.]
MSASTAVKVKTASDSTTNYTNSLPAILGGQPAFTDIQPVGKPNMPDRQAFLSRMESVLDSARLTNFGPLVQEFEKKVARHAGTRHCIATCNATTGLELAINALGMQGDVIVPSFTFVATVHALWRQGVQPIFCDVDPQTHCLDPASVEAAITSRTSGILAVHMWGNSAATAAIRNIAHRHGIKLLFDAAHAFGCASGGSPIGSSGDAEVFSFHATKFVHAFEGGAIVTDNSQLADKLRLMTNFGFADEDVVLHLGMNGKMSEASAAMGLTSLEAMSTIVDHNRRNYQAFAKGLAAIQGVNLMSRSLREPHNYHYIVTEIDASVAGLNRDELVAALRLENVLARRYFYPGCHRMEPYASLFPRAGQSLPLTEQIAERVMILPTGLAMSKDDVALLTSRIATLVSHASAVRKALSLSNDPRIPSFLNR